MQRLPPFWRRSVATERGWFIVYDMKNLRKLKSLEANAPEAIQAFWAFDKAAMAAGAIPGKYKELMALAVAFTTQCPYCIEIHAKKAERRALPIQRSRRPSRLPQRFGLGRQ
jgi:AhpD family alkylhydroperoxidase